MKKLQKTGSFIRGLAAGAAILACVSAAQAHPYASEISNNVGTISFFLNESAGSVSITLTNVGLGQGTTIAGTTSRGAQTFSLTQSSVTYSNFAITVQKNGTGVFASNGPDFNVDIFEGPRAVAVNMNPKTHNFGRIYVVNASPATGIQGPLAPGDSGLPGRAMGKGMFVLNADGSDCDGYSGTSHPTLGAWPPGESNTTVGNTYSGLGWGTSTTYGPWKAWVGPDDMVYVADGTSYTTGQTEGGTVWMMDPDLLTPYPLLPYVGTASPAAAANAGPACSRPIVTGSLAQGNLILSCMEFDFTGGFGLNYIQQYTVTNTTTATLPYTGQPTTLGQTSGGYPGGLAATEGVTYDIYQGPISGEWYMCIDRSSQGGGIPGCEVFDPTGNNLLWNSIEAPATINTDPLIQCYSVAVSPDEKYMAAVIGNVGNIVIMNITNNGAGVYAPDLTTCVTNAIA
ncbi:MAG TPA: hypothetical protein VK731_02715, partial [Candidatus Cybelea sp.]|nr:hypothetical protein [Candidatus Cybelea sp.]